MKKYVFTIALQGYGDNTDIAWTDAVEAFTEDPGATPDDPEFIAEFEDGEDE